MILMKHYYSFLYALSLIILFNFQIHAQTSQPKYSKEIENKISLVENNLSGWVQLSDSVIHFSLDERMNFYKAHGVSIAVIHNYKLEWARGYGMADVAEQRPVNTQTLFQAASISKSLNAVGILKLVQAGRVSLTDDINHYFKTFKFPSDSSADFKKITIGNLLSHTAGLTVHGFAGYQAGDTIPSILEVIQGQRPANNEPVKSQFASGARVEYSGGGITLSQLIVMDVTDEHYDKYQWNNVLEPLGMVRSFYTQPPPDNKKSFLATGYHEDGAEVKGKFHIYPEMAAAGLWTNPTDLSSFIIEMQDAYRGKSDKVLSKNMAHLMLTPYLANTTAGLGVFVEKKGDHIYFGHGGANEGFRSQYYGSLEGGDGVVVMVNSDNGEIINEIINSVSKVYDWKNFYQPTIKKIVQVPVDTLDKYTGEYVMKDITLSIKRNGYHLYVFQNGNSGLQIFFTSNTDFFLFEVPAEASFMMNENGKTTSIKLHQNGSDFSFLRKD
jgi:CubicO group peptidase (beta-lactamase class C family)